MKHANVAIFVPHNGCPHQCAFCNQKSITGKVKQPTISDVISSINVAIESLGEKTTQSEIAFFGGSFTAIDRKYMLSLLDATTEYIDRFKGIRISTRPDYINDEVLKILKEYKVTSIELGAQSMDDYVLSSNERGHTAYDIIKASNLIKSFSFDLGLQMMTGLFCSDDSIDIYTANEFIKLKPSTVRIYPTIVMKNTKLGDLYNEGEYQPQSLEDAVNLCSYLLSVFNENDINVIRLGLHDSVSLKNDMLAGPYHPSFRELCESKMFYDKFTSMISHIDKKDVVVYINNKSVSKFIGNNKMNINKINNLGINLKIMQDDTLGIYDMRIS